MNFYVNWRKLRLNDVNRHQMMKIDVYWRQLTSNSLIFWRLRQISSIFVNYSQNKISNFLIFQIRHKTSNNVMKCPVTSKASKNVIADASSQWRQWKNDEWRQSDVRDFLVNYYQLTSIEVNRRHLTPIYSWHFQHYKTNEKLKEKI